MQAFARLLDIMDELREKCPWDKKQTMQTLRPLTIEEVYELTDAILKNNYNEVKKELGDVLLHIIFYAKIASESNFFDIEEVINTICDKLIERHPHIYGNVSVRDEEEVKYNWEKIKLNTGSKGVLAGVPQSLPSLVKAYRIQEKVAGIGFDWKEVRDVRDKIQEEFDELEQLAKYDYSSDLNENILGHVFEKSMTDLEKLKANQNNENYDKKVGNQKRTGAFYTPKYIVQYIVKNAIDNWLEDRKKELGYYNLPEVEEQTEVEIRSEDLRIDTYRASGARTDNM